MKKFKNLFIVMGAVLLLAGSTFLTSFSWGKGDCRVPSTNTKYCYSSPDWVDDCTKRPYDCLGQSQFIVCQFPDGTTPSDAGHTKEVREDCYTETRCVPVEDPPGCTVGITLPVQKAVKIVAKDNNPCE
jgi:hypothetical protein